MCTLKPAKRSIKQFVIIFFLFFGFNQLAAQDFIPLWPKGKMPNSKGMKLTDSISGERYRRVGTPGLLAFFPSKEENRGTAVLICPGGGYKHYAHIISGTQFAKWFNAKGVNAFVLLARFPHSPDLLERHTAPLQDAQRAMKLIRANAAEWGIDPARVGVIGFSAGGHVASTLGTHTNDLASISDSWDTIPARPNFMLLVSPVITMGEFTHKGSRENLLGVNPTEALVQSYSNELQVSEQTPPAFIVHAENDRTVSPENSLLLYRALRHKGISASLHVFPLGGHSIGLENNPGSTALWKDLCWLWLDEMGFVGKK